jgi:inorganic triphosphatase YgiF
MPDIGRIGDPGIRERIGVLIGVEALGPVFEMHIQRLAVAFDDGKTRAELALDRGEVRAGDRAAPILAAELELDGGDAAGMFALAHRLFDGIAIRFSTESKAGRGYRLVTAEGPAAPAPVRAALPELAAGTEAGDAFGRIAAAAAAGIIANREALIAGDDPEAAHQLRIGLRHMRSALAAFRPVLAPERTRRLDRMLRRAGRLVGGLRDRDVLLTELVLPIISRSGEAAGGAALTRALERACARERRSVRRKFSGAGWNELLLDLAMLAGGVGLSGTRPAVPVDGIAGAALEAAWRRAERRAKDLKRLGEEDRHRLRKTLKRLRCTAEFFRPLYPAAETKAFVEALKALQDGFGYLNDVALVRDLAAVAGAGRSDHAMRRATAFLAGWHEAVAEREWEASAKRWKALRRQPKFWRRGEGATEHPGRS